MFKKARLKTVFHKAVRLELCEGTTLEVTFQDGKVKRYDMADLFGKYPQLTALKDRDLFLSGMLKGHFGIIWNDDLDIDAECIYDLGNTVRTEYLDANYIAGEAVYQARMKRFMSQKELADATGIDQSDLSKIERGAANPSVGTLSRIAKALGFRLMISFEGE